LSLLNYFDLSVNFSTHLKMLRVNPPFLAH